MNKKSIQVYGSIILSMFFWGLSFVWIKIVYTVYSPLTAIFIPLVISTFLLFVVGKISKTINIVKKQDLRLIALLAFFEPFIYFMGEGFGLKYVSPTVGSVIISTIPLFTPLAAYIFYKEKVSLNIVIGMIISMIGVMLIIFNKDMKIVVSIKGILLLSIAVCAAVGYALVLKKLSSEYSAITLIVYQNLFGTIFFLPFFLIFDFQEFIYIPILPGIWLRIIEVAVFSSSLSYILFAYSMKFLGVNQTNAFINMMPVFTAFFAYLLIGDTLSLRKILGIFVVIVGLFLSNQKIKIVGT